MKYENIKSPEELLKFMNQHITYGFVSKSGKKYEDSLAQEWANDWYNECIVQTGEEVLKTKIGTCFDQVELERLWFKNHNYKIKTIFIWFEIEEVNDLPTHTFLIYNKDGKYYWFENASWDNRGIHEFNNIEEAIEYVKQRQMEYLVNVGKYKKKYYNLIKAYEYDKPLSNLSIEEYLKHVTKNNQINN